MIIMLFDFLRLLLIIGFIGLNGVFIQSCQPPPMGLYNNAYNQYSYSANQQQQQQPYQQQQLPQQINYQPPFDASSAAANGAAFIPQQQQQETSNQILSAPLPPPTLVPSFLQDNSPEDEIAAFERNLIVPISTESPSLINSQPPPPDPPANPFLGDSRPKSGGFIEENSSEMLQEFLNKCSRDGVKNLNDFLDCTDGVPYSVSAEHAQYGSDKCDFEPEFVCRFYSSPDEALQFKSGQFRINPKTNKIFDETFANLMKRSSVGNLPERTFVYLDIKRKMYSSAMLKTDILCQKGDGKLKFDYWSSDENVVMKVCTSNENERSCTKDIVYDTNSSKIEVDVIHPESTQFALEIIVTNFSRASVFIIDNLEYDGEICDNPQFAVTQTVSTTTTTQSSPPVSRNQAFGSQLQQNYLPLPHQSFQPLNNVGALFQPQPPQFIATEQPSSIYGSYVTPPPLLQHPTYPTPVFNNLRINQYQQLPQNPEPKQNPLQYSPYGYSVKNESANNHPQQQEISPGVLFVQNKYTQPPTSRTPIRQMKIVSKQHQKQQQQVSNHRRGDACDSLKCSFDQNFCQYSQSNVSARGLRYGKWQISRSQIGNPLTGIKSKDHGGFAFVGMDEFSAKVKGRTVYVLESPEFSLDSDTLLSFDLYRRSAAITLQVCINSLTNCPYEAPKMNTKIYWKEGESILLSKNTKKIYFVATQWKRFKWLAIDNIILNKGRGCNNMQATAENNKMYGRKL